MRSTSLLSRAGVLGTAAAMAVTLTPTAATSVTVVPPVAPQAVQAPASEVVDVRLEVAGKPVQRVAARRGTWPASVLSRHGVRADGNDLVVLKRNGKKKKGANRRLRQGDKIAVVDVQRRTRVKRVKVKPRTVTVPTTELKPGRRKVVRPGKPAVHRLTIRRTLHNEKVVDKKVVKRKVVRKAKPRRVLVGRKATSVPGADRLNWAGLARCESGGNPRAVNAAGYYGLYQFNVGTWRSVGGSGMPHQASPGEQTYRAKLLYQSRGSQPWPHCGRYL